MLRSRTLPPWALILMLTAVGCDGLLSPQLSSTVADGQLTIARLAADAPPLLPSEVTFWAVRGATREAEIRYAAVDGYSGKCLRFVVPAQALLRYADGTVVAPGDSVQITIRVVDPQLFLFEFDPGGLRFDPSHPAQMEVRYRWAADDLDGDGEVDEADAAIAENLGIWRQERPGEQWTRIPSTRLSGEPEVHAEITGFTRYALASDRQREFAAVVP